MMKPIRVGFIGLNSSQNVQYAGAWGLSAHLPYLKQSEHYTITALCNSSQESAVKAIQLHGLDADKVKAYGDPESLANDPNVDIVVCSVKVTEHYKLVRPAVLAAKSVFCEWPLASNLTQMKELARTAEQKKTQTIVGLQGRNGPYVQAIRKNIGDGGSRLGQVLSTSLVSYTYIFGMANPTDLAYMTEIKNGGNLFTISGIHLLDTITAALGDIKSSNTILRNKRPTIPLVDSSSHVVEAAHPNSGPEHIFVQGELKGDIPFSFQVRGGPQFKDTPAFDWRIYCQRGEIRVFGDNQLWLAPGVKLQVYDFATQTVNEVDLQKFVEDNDKDDVAVRLGLQAPADNVARLYEAFAKGETEKYLDFKQSLKWAEFIQNAYIANGF
ncbi:hypothetical protein PV04_04583 [Phialophora macrospora]|uniref:Uncharacterized protein n=1 Tax=Phialophora macrospora TaxID=1851006 RepID=A0A0D2FPZ1_9EURO|nr:hypothetical protein PV04_04583 [Phialophora macrospora]